MPNAADVVWVYRYKYWDEGRRAFGLSVRYATLETIRNGLGIADLSSGQRISASMVVNGIYHPGIVKHAEQ